MPMQWLQMWMICPGCQILYPNTRFVVKPEGVSNVFLSFLTIKTSGGSMKTWGGSVRYFPLKKLWRVQEKIGENEEVKFFSTSSHVKKWNCFVFHDVAISSFVQYINSRLQKCNLFACTPTGSQDDSTLSKRTRHYHACVMLRSHSR